MRAHKSSFRSCIYQRDAWLRGATAVIIMWRCFSCGRGLKTTCAHVASRLFSLAEKEGKADVVCTQFQIMTPQEILGTGQSLPKPRKTAIWPIFCDNSWGWKLCSGATDCIHAQWVCLHAKQKYWCISHGPGSFGALGPRWCDSNKLWISLIIVLNLRWPVWKLVANNYFKKSFRKTNSELWEK